MLPFFWQGSLAHNRCKTARNSAGDAFPSEQPCCSDKRFIILLHTVAELMLPESPQASFKGYSLHSEACSSCRKARLVGTRNTAFSVAAPLIWSSLPLETRTAPSLMIFRKLVKTKLFLPAFNWVYVY